MGGKIIREAVYVVSLNEEEQEYLSDLVSKGKSAAIKIKHANMLLSLDRNGSNMSIDDVTRIFRCHRKTVYNLRKRFVEEGLDAALKRKKRETPPTAPKLDGEAEARLISLACSQPPEGRNRWTLCLLADKLVELQIVSSISHETVRKTLKKTNLSRISRNVR